MHLNRTVILVCMLVSLEFAQVNGETSTSKEDHIARVEKGLLPIRTPKGQIGTGHNLIERMVYYKAPGISIAVINNGMVEWAKGYGVAEVGGGQITPKTMFQAGSISKSVAAMGALYLVDHKVLNLDEDVNLKLRSWKVPDNDYTKDQKVSLRRLLSHTAGLTVHGFPGYATDATIPSLTKVLDGEKPANTPPIRVDVIPGTIWRYSGGGYTVMQQLMIDVTGKPFPEFMKETVLDKLQMTSSTFAQPIPDSQAVLTATGHYPNGTKVKGRWHIYPEMAAAGLWTTPTDLAKFAIAVQQALAGKSQVVLSQAMTREMLKNQKDNDGLGVFLEGSGKSLRFSHGGRDEGFDSKMVAYADGGQGAVIMANANLNNDLVNEILRAIAVEYKWPGYPIAQREEFVVPSSVLESYTGRYQLAPGFFLTVTHKAGQITLSATGQGEVELVPESQTTFAAAVADAKITFTRDSAGKIVELVLTQNGKDLRAKRVQ